MGAVNLTGEVQSQQDFMRWLADGGLRGATELVLWSAELDDAAAVAIAAHPDARELRALDLSHNHVGCAGTEALARSLAELKGLRLYHNAIGAQGAAAIASAPWRLVHLNLCGNALGPEGVTALRGPAVEHVESLALGWNELGDAGGLALAMGQWPRLAELNVRSNELTQAGIMPLLGGGLFQLTRLGIDDNALGDDGLAAIVEAPGFRRLTWLNLTGTDLTARALEILARADTTTLRELRIGENGVSEDSVDRLPNLAHCVATEKTWELTLSIEERGGKPRHETFRERYVTFGRVQGNTIVLPKGNVAKRHCRLSVDKQGRVIAVDLKSTNGTWINGRQMHGPTVISECDKLYVGDFIIRLVGPPRAIE